MDNENQAAPQNQGVPSQQNDKVMAIVAYIIFFVPLLVGKRSPFVTYHTNQGTVLFIFAVVGGIVLSILLGFIPFLGIISMLFDLLVLVLMIIGIMNASKGVMKPLPIIGGFTIIK